MTHDRQTFYFINKKGKELVTDDYGRVVHPTDTPLRLETYQPKIVFTQKQFEEFDMLKKKYNSLFLALYTLETTSPALFKLLTASSSSVENNYTLSLLSRVYAVYEPLRPFDFIEVQS